MAGLDLSGVAAFIDGDLIVDEVLIVQDNGAADDVLDDDTGALVPAESEVVYAGRGAVQPLSGFTAVQDPDVQRAAEESGATYRLLLPLAADVDRVSVGNLAQVTAVHGETADESLRRRVFKVVEMPQVSSFAVMRVVYLTQVGTAGPVDPA